MILDLSSPCFYNKNINNNNNNIKNNDNNIKNHNINKIIIIIMTLITCSFVVVNIIVDSFLFSHVWTSSSNSSRSVSSNSCLSCVGDPSTSLKFGSENRSLFPWKSFCQKKVSTRTRNVNLNSMTITITDRKWPTFSGNWFSISGATSSAKLSIMPATLQAFSKKYKTRAN